jgi:hypothetical protein
MERIGANVSMTWRCTTFNNDKKDNTGSGADTEDAAKYLRRIGYSGGEKGKYNMQAVQSSLLNRRPVLTRGYQTKKSTWLLPTRYGGGHAWVIDGYLNHGQEIRIEIQVFEAEIDWRGVPSMFVLVHSGSYISTRYLPYFHHNWGWNATFNGFFAAGVFDTERRSFASNGNTLPSNGINGNFQHNIEVFTNIRR